MIFKEKTLSVVHVEEPALKFGFGQTETYPKVGLTLYGPANSDSKLKIQIGVIGTKSGITHFRTWARSIQKHIPIPPRTERDKEHRPHLSDFPGVEEAFGLSFDTENFVEYEIDDSDIEKTSSTANIHEAVSKTVDLFIDPIATHHREEEKSIDVWVLIVNELIFTRCRPESKRSGVALTPGEFVKQRRKREFMPLLAPILDQTDEKIFDDTPDFHRQVKARMLSLDKPTQILRETTLAPEAFLNVAGYPIRKTQDPATKAWNLATGLFYKTQPSPPWHIAEMREGVCYVGLVFKQIPNHPQNHACCAAQMFLSEGDGVVFRGANGPWMTEDKQFHLSSLAAKNLISKVLTTYKSKFGSFPKELFIHGRTNFSKDEWSSFCDAAPSETNLVAIRIRPTSGDVKLFREGDYPCLRGTAILANERNAYLWTSGYAPRIDTYLGPETPNPLFITILKHTGELPTIKSVMTDIMGLTKINYNGCNFSESLPVTIRFADKVGEVLVMGSAGDAARQPFKFYI